MDYIDALNWRFACKEFSSKAVPEEDVEYLMEAARLAPSSYNVQPWHIVVVQDAGLLKELLPVSYNQSQVLTTGCLFVFCANTSFEDAFGKVIASMKADGTYSEGYEEAVRSTIGRYDAHQFFEYAQRQLYIALGMLLSAAAMRRIDAGPMEGLDRQGVAKVLGLPEQIIPFANVAVGYRKEDPTRKKSRLPRDVAFGRR